MWAQNPGAGLLPSAGASDEMTGAVRPTCSDSCRSDDMDGTRYARAPARWPSSRCVSADKHVRRRKTLSGWEPSSPGGARGASAETSDRQPARVSFSQQTRARCHLDPLTLLQSVQARKVFAEAALVTPTDQVSLVASSDLNRHVLSAHHVDNPTVDAQAA